MGPIYRGGIVPKGTGTTVKSRMLLNSHCETLGVLMQVEGVALDLATEALVGARNTMCISLFHHWAFKAAARPIGPYSTKAIPRV
jgi:hypothetical protein